MSRVLHRLVVRSFHAELLFPPYRLSLNRSACLLFSWGGFCSCCLFCDFCPQASGFPHLALPLPPAAFHLSSL